MTDKEFEELEQKYRNEVAKRRELDTYKSIKEIATKGNMTVRLYINDRGYEFESRKSERHYRICKAVIDEAEKIAEELEKED